MSAPRLNRRLDLERVVRVPDGGGGYVETWESLGRLWGEILPGTGSDLTGEERMLSAVSLRVTVRAAPVGSPSRPVAGQRFREGQRLYLIRAVSERDSAGRYLTCFAREEVPK